MESAAQSLLGNVAHLLGEEYQLLRGVGSEVADLRDDLATMNALLVMQSEAEDGAVDRFVREWMKQLRELAYDSEDCVDHYKLRVKSRPGDGVGAWLKRLTATLFLRRCLASEIRALRARGVTIGERHARYGVNRDALRRSATLPAPAVLAASASAHAALRRPGNDYRLVGITDQADDLIKRLKEQQAGGEQHREVFSLVGFGGVGKTTLAVELCRRLETEFPYQAFVSVSQAFEPSRDLDALLKRVLQMVTNTKTKNEDGIKEEEAVCNTDGWDHDKLALELKNSLEKKRYLIVIDDIWTIRAWEAIEQALPENKCSSRIIVTTRIDSVANACSVATVHIHHMKPLDDKYSKQLFLSRAFGSMEDTCPPDLEDVLNVILKKCGGLPLAIVSIASVLAGYTSAGSKDKWETVCKSIGSQMETHPTLEGMRHIVTLSYNHLPHELKFCMMYLSIFPEDYEINKGRLLRRWIAEGLVQEKRGLTLMEVAESYLDDLVSRNMVVPKFGNDGKVESCKVHDMLLEVMVSKSLECNFVSLLGGQYAEMLYDRIRRLSIHGGDEPRAQQPKKNRTGRGIEEMDKEHVRSFSMFQQSAHKLLDHLDKFTLLRVLDLEGCQGLTNKHVRCICRLYLLKFLSLKNTMITKLPSQVGKLEHLQTLDVYDASLKGLPKAVTNLEKLEYVAFHSRRSWRYLWRLPRGLKKMQALHDVDTAILPDDVQVARELGELQQLQSISVYIDCVDGSNVLPVLADSLGKLYSIRRLNICHYNTGNGKMNFLYELPKPPQLLRYLRIEGILDHGLPNWVRSLTHLVEITIMRTQLVGDQLFDVLWKLPNLKSITMGYNCYIDEVIVARNSHRFPVLSNLDVSWADYEIHFEHGSMEQLETLQVQVRDQNKDLVSIENLPNLKKVQLSGQTNSTSLQHALDQLLAENRRRAAAKSKQFEVVVRSL